MRSGDGADAGGVRPPSRRRCATAARALSQLNRWLCGVAGLITLILPLPVLYEVVMDQIGHPPVWVFEMSGYAILMIAFAASGHGLGTGHHFRVNVMSHKFPRMARPLSALSGLLEAIFGLVLAVAGFHLAYGSWADGLRSDTLLAIPQVWPQIALPLGGIGILLQGTAHLLQPPNWRDGADRFASQT